MTYPHPGLSNDAATPTRNVSPAWLTLPEPDKRARMLAALAAIPDGARVELVAVKERECVVRLRERLAPSVYGALLMHLERDLRAALGEPVEVYCELVTDRNKPRAELQARISAWRERRQQMRQANMEAARDGA